MSLIRLLSWIGWRINVTRPRLPEVLRSDEPVLLDRVMPRSLTTVMMSSPCTCESFAPATRSLVIPALSILDMNV